MSKLSDIVAQMKAEEEKSKRLSLRDALKDYDIKKQVIRQIESQLENMECEMALHEITIASSEKKEIYFVKFWIDVGKFSGTVFGKIELQDSGVITLFTNTIDTMPSNTPWYELAVCSYTSFEDCQAEEIAINEKIFDDMTYFICHRSILGKKKEKRDNLEADISDFASSKIDPLKDIRSML